MKDRMGRQMRDDDNCCFPNELQTAYQAGYEAGKSDATRPLLEEIEKLKSGLSKAELDRYNAEDQLRYLERDVRKRSGRYG